MRDIATVLDRCLAEVPKDFEGRAGLEADFKSIKSSARYCAPELMPMQWERAAEALTWNLGPWQPGFRIKVAEIFAGLK
jgi:hypothetical protein